MSNTAFETTFYAAILEFVKANHDSDAVEVTYVDDRTEWSGGCETCEYEYTVLDIDYKVASGKSKTYTHSGGFADLISSL